MMANAIDGLAAALERQITALPAAGKRYDFHARAASIIDVGALQHEMRACQGDAPRLALAKAVARHCLNITPAKSERAVEYARALQGDCSAQRTIDSFQLLHAVQPKKGV